jgi:hypothetical protein
MSMGKGRLHQSVQSKYPDVYDMGQLYFTGMRINLTNENVIHSLQTHGIKIQAKKLKSTKS